MGAIDTKIKSLVSEKDSPIAYIRYRNYQSLEDVTIDFGDKNRVILSAYNSTGKSAVARGLEVLAYYAYPKEYKDHISDDQEECEINLGLRNGIVITRVFTHKYQYYTVKGMGIDLDTRISDNAYMVMEGNKPPLIVQKLLNFAIEPETKQKLNIRYAEDGLLFSRTTGSVNYKTFYNALDLPELTQAIRTANDDKNSLNNKIDELRTKRNLLKDKEIRIRVFDSDILKDNINKLSILDNKIESLDTIMNNVNARQEVQASVPPNVKPVDITGYMELLGLERLLETKQNCEAEIKSLRAVQQIDMTMFKDIVSLVSLANNKSVIDSNLRKTPYVEGIETGRLKAVAELSRLHDARKIASDDVAKTAYVEVIGTSRINDIIELYKLLYAKSKFNSELKKTNGVEALNNMLNSINGLRSDESKLSEIKVLYDQKQKVEMSVGECDSEISKIIAMRDELSEQIKAEGYVKCPNCNHLFKTEEGCNHDTDNR